MGGLVSVSRRVPRLKGARFTHTRSRPPIYSFATRNRVASPVPSRPVPSRLVALLFNSSCLCSHWGS